MEVHQGDEIHHRDDAGESREEYYDAYRSALVNFELALESFEESEGHQAEVHEQYEFDNLEWAHDTNVEVAVNHR